MELQRATKEGVLELDRIKVRLVVQLMLYGEL